MSKLEPVSVAITQFLAQLSSKHSPHKTLADTSNNTSSSTSSNTLSKERKFIIAFSGGADSLALLHELSQQLQSSQILAVYVDHQLQAESSVWAEQNRVVCQKLHIQYEAVEVTIDSDVASLENSARNARYEALSDFIEDEECYLLTGHHQDDQAETLLLQLFRGAGPKGLSAMPELTRFGKGFHARPMLSVTKQDIVNYCEQYQLDYIEDPSNQNSRHRRNFLRGEVLPMLETVWPDLKSTLSRVCSLQASTQEVVEERAAEDFLESSDPDRHCLNIDSLARLSAARLDNTLRYWFQLLKLEMPSQKVLKQLTDQMLNASEDAQPSVTLEQGSFRRFDRSLYWVPKQSTDFTLKEAVEWSGEEDLIVTPNVTLNAGWLQQHHPELMGSRLMVTVRKGGERFRKYNSENTTSLKNFLQDAKIPTWQRDKVLLIVCDDEVRAVYTQHLKTSH